MKLNLASVSMTNGLKKENTIKTTGMRITDFKKAILLTGISLGGLTISFAQSGKYGADSAECVKNLSLYREYMKQKSYNDAIIGWRYVIKNCPQASLNTFVDGTTLITNKIETTKDAAKKEKYIDTLFWVYDTRIQAFGREAYVLGRKSVDILRFRPNEAQMAYDASKKSFDGQGDKTEAAPLGIYFQSALMLLKENKLTQAEALDVYNKVSEVLEKGAAGDPKTSEFYKQGQTTVESLFLNSPLATCEAVISAFQAKFDADPKNVELLRKITDIMGKLNCTEDKLFLDAATALYAIEPDAKAATNIARLNYKKKNFSEAIKYYKQALDGTTDNSAKVQLHFELAAAYQGTGDYSASRSEALKAVAIDPSFGKAYMLIGDLYANSASKCDVADNPTAAKSVYWIATDMYQKAKSADASLADDISSRISRCVANYPGKEDLFFISLKEGDSYSVGCWINGNTTVRAR